MSVLKSPSLTGTAAHRRSFPEETLADGGDRSQVPALTVLKGSLLWSFLKNLVPLSQVYFRSELCLPCLATFPWWLLLLKAMLVNFQVRTPGGYFSRGEQG